MNKTDSGHVFYQQITKSVAEVFLTLLLLLVCVASYTETINIVVQNVNSIRYLITGHTDIPAAADDKQLNN